ncbi:MAG: PAS domain-containing protein [Haloarculaceae archaeon]
MVTGRPETVTALWVAPSHVEFEGALADRGVDLVHASDREQALARATSESIDAAVVDGAMAEALDTVADLTEATTLPVVSLVPAGLDDENDYVTAALDGGAAATVATRAPAAIANHLHRAVRHAADRQDAHLLEQLLSGLHVESGDTIFFKDEHSRFVRVSESKAVEVGESREEVRGKSDFDYMSEAEARKRYEDEQEIMATGEPLFGTEERIVTADGDVRWYRVTKLPRRNEDGDIVGTYGLSRDITELKQLEETLSELEAVIDRVPVWLLAVDADGEVTWANEPAAARLLDDGDLVGRSFETLTSGGPLSSDFRDRYERAVDALLEEQEPGGDPPDSTVDRGTTERHVSHEVPLELPDGERRFCDVHARLLPLADGEFNGTVLAFHDVTTQVEQERELERQYERLERLVHTISHDLRNPLQVATGHIDIAAEQYDSDLIDRAADAVDRMDVLVDELLTMAREGRELDDPEPVSLSDVVRAAWQPFADESATLTVAGDATLQADRSRLRRLFENTFRNAVEHGGPDVTVTVGPMADGEGFFVADDGPGIPESDREDVLEFGFSTSDEGTGFGLAIVDEIARAHGWDVTVTESEAGGARFEFEPAS